MTGRRTRALSLDGFGAVDVNLDGVVHIGSLWIRIINSRSGGRAMAVTYTPKR